MKKKEAAKVKVRGKRTDRNRNPKVNRIKLIKEFKTRPKKEIEIKFGAISGNKKKCGQTLELLKKSKSERKSKGKKRKKKNICAEVNDREQNDINQKNPSKTVKKKGKNSQTHKNPLKTKRKNKS